MVAWRPLFLVLLGAALAATGIALGAASQHESFLIPEDAEGFAEPGAASGNLVVLTAALVATGLLVIALNLSQLRPLQQIGPGLGLWLGVYLLVVLIQSAWPNYNAEDTSRTAAFAIAPLATNEPAIGSTVLGPMALLAGAIMLTGVTGKRLLGVRHRNAPDAMLGRAVGLALFSAPFFSVAAAGNVRLLLGLPAQSPASLPYLIVLPLLALACIGLLIIMTWQALQLGLWLRNGHLAGATEETWKTLRVAAFIVAGLVAALAITAGFLEAIGHGRLQAGRTFAVTLRGHVQFHMLLLIPLASWIAVDRSVMAALQDAKPDASLTVQSHPAAIGLAVAVGASLVLAMVSVFAFAGAMWAWVWAALPAAVAASIVLSPRQSLGASAVFSLALWSTGNTIVGSFQLTNDGGDVIDFAMAPGASALLRLLAVTWFAVACARLAHQDAAHLGMAKRWPLALAIGTGVALLLALELPFTAWTETVELGEFVGIGSLVASQSDAVQSVTHSLAAAAVAGICIAVARIHRPDWFGRDPAAVSAPTPLVEPMA